MGKKFTEYSNFNLSDVNKEVLKDWDAKDLFHKSISEREGNPTFVFFEGPPSANGMPGIHHVMARSIKDIFCRYKTMKGFHVKRKAGWDTHGLPVELGVEKELGITKEDIGKKISVDDYNNACRTNVMKFTKEWTDLTHKMGYWVDLENPYITYDNKYIETLWYLLKDLYKKGYLYKGYTIQPYSPAAGTGLSSHELNQPGCYRDVKDTTVVAQFKMVDPKPEMTQHGTPYFLAWTTTPWTLSSNTALCVGPKIEYVAVQSFNPYTGEPATYVCAKALLNAHFNPKAAEIAFEDYKAGDKLVPFKVVAEYKGTDLVGMKYEQLLPWITPENADQAFRVIPGDYVTTEDGTGIVHIAPTFGADDAKVAKAAGIPPLQLLDKNGNLRPSVDLTGKFYLLSDLDDEYVKTHINVDEYKQFEGRFVKNAYDKNLTDKDETLDVAICMLMKATNKAFKIEKHVHNYPHCWRTDKPVLYYPLDSWFIKSTAARERMIELNKTILWKPESTGTGRFGKWLENLNDWNLSRSRYWGTPLPIWRTEDGAEEKCIGSLEELMAEIDKSVKAGFMKSNPWPNFKVGDYSKENYDPKNIDLHRPYVDNIILVSDSGKPMKRETDLIDVWFDSGAMPFAQMHYPFENKDVVDNGEFYPANFIAEGVDQTRGWFFTLHAISTMVKDSVAFKAVISNGLVLDKNGNKMSKRLGNAVDPFGAIEKYGSDPLRWYMITNASPWDNLRFDEEGVDEVRRKFFGTLYNTYSFFALYANVDGFDYSQAEVPMNERQEIDRWIISLLNTLVKDVDAAYSDYEPTKAGRAISTFVCDNLSNWYVRLCRKRFWGGEMTKDKLSAYQTLYTCLETVSRLMAPISPFYADRVFLDLNAATGKDKSESVHLAKFPVADEKLINKTLEERMQLAQDISSMTLALRKKENIKVRQPLTQIMVPILSDNEQENIEAVKDLIMNEVNVKAINFVTDASGILVKRIKPDFKKLGPKCGKNMKTVAQMLTEFSQEQIAELEKNGQYTLDVAGASVVVEKGDVEILSEDIPGWLVANNGQITIALDVTITDELKEEGIAREFVNRIQNIRKSSGFEITDKILVEIEKKAEINAAVEHFAQYIASQVLANEVKLVDSISGATELDFDDYKVNVKVVKA
ncbi:MAG: isoleucine--tRNA ligase [Bacteroidales bacterium]|jgi:isoleucyl-tRNA synthetase|nr:isoleucine--tRNA ligase [Bacteroidales bacterium]